MSTTMTTANLAFSSSPNKVFSWLYELVRDLITGISIGVVHPFTLTRKWMYSEVLIPTVNGLFGLHLRKDKVVHSKDGQETLKVVVVGYGRTGTYSLTMALEEMGFPTLHTQHLYENHALFDMWNEQVFQPSMAANATLMGKPDLQMIASYGYQGTADLPMALYFEQVMEEYPDCKFILTTRESSDVWFKSWDRLTKSINPPAQRGARFAWSSSCQKLSNYFAWLYSHINKDTYYLAKPNPFPNQNREQAIASYEAHNRNVRAKIPKDKLLEYSIKDGGGWEPLCNFMNLTDTDCPTNSPFPRSNSIRSVQIQAFVAQLTPLVAVAATVLYFMRRRCLPGRRTTCTKKCTD